MKRRNFLKGSAAVAIASPVALLPGFPRVAPGLPVAKIARIPITVEAIQKARAMLDAANVPTAGRWASFWSPKLLNQFYRKSMEITVKDGLVRKIT